MLTLIARRSALGVLLLAVQTAVAQDSKPPTVVTRPATTLGTEGMTSNGSIHPHGLPTTYWFEYGPTAEYGQKTAVAPLPPRLAAHYVEDWNDNGGGWFAGRAAPKELVYHKEGGVTGGFMRYRDPIFDDHNHDNGIGTVHLAMYCYPGPWGPAVAKVPSLQLAAGDPDLRDARVSIALRGVDWVPNGSRLQWWTQSQKNIDEVLYDTKKSHVANWAYTGADLADHLRSGKWEKATYRLWNDTEKWTYTGGTGIYKYWSINDAQTHLNVDFFHMVTFVDVKNRPKGAIDFDDFELTYRNHSLVLPSNGGKLLRAPASPSNPATLTDGWRNGKGRQWSSAPNQPLEFVYGFQDPVTIKALQLHQNPEWPSKDVEVLVSDDDKNYAPLAKQTLPEKGTPNANFGFTLDTGLSAKARFLKVRILSGYKKEQWGLGEIEVFGAGATMTPEDDVNYVNLDIEGLKPGSKYHYRLVAKNSAGTTLGADRTYVVPVDQKPIAETRPAEKIAAESARLFGRLTPMGPETKYYFEYGPDTKYGLKTPESRGGIQIVPRDVFADVTGLKGGTTYHYRLVATNAKGTTESADTTLTTMGK